MNVCVVKYLYSVLKKTSNQEADVMYIWTISPVDFYCSQAIVSALGKEMPSSRAAVFFLLKSKRNSE